MDMDAIDSELLRTFRVVVDAGRISKDELFAHGEALLKARIGAAAAAHKPPAAVTPRAPSVVADVQHQPAGSTAV